jgi:hypothetical protein
LHWKPGLESADEKKPNIGLKKHAYAYAYVDFCYHLLLLGVPLTNHKSNKI